MYLVVTCAGLPCPVNTEPQALPPSPLNDVEQRFARIDTEGEHLTACINGMIPKPQYRATATNFLFGLRNHFQGIELLPQPGYLAISGSSKRAAELFIVHLASHPPSTGCGGEVVARTTVDEKMSHAGGLSRLGSTLAVPVHGGSPLGAKVVFYDLAVPEAPRRLSVEIVRPGRKASATAMTRLANGYTLVAIVAQFDGLPLRLDLYLSRTSVLTDGFLPEPLGWPVSGVEAKPDADRTFNHFQSINFVNQADGRLYLVGFHNTVGPQTVFPGRDYADLYEVVFPNGMIDGERAVLTKPSIIKVGSRKFSCTDRFCNFDAAAGLFVDPVTGAMSVYATPGWLDGNTLKITRFSSRDGEPEPPSAR